MVRISGDVEVLGVGVREFSIESFDTMLFSTSLITAMMTGGVVLVVWQGSERVVDGVMTAGEFIAFLERYLRFANRGIPWQP